MLAVGTLDINFLLTEISRLSMVLEETEEQLKQSIRENESLKQESKMLRNSIKMLVETGGNSE